MSRVLIVDDSADNLYLLRALLQGHGCEVEEARHGAEALAKARQHPPDLIITDLLMPVMDGYTLLRHWKADERLKTIPFIVYTATYTQPQDEKLALSLGADIFIVKPVEPEPFMDRVREVLTLQERTELSPPHQPVGDERDVLKSYNGVLVRKLEEKVRQLEQANGELAKREARLRALVDTEPECVKLLGPDGALRELNPAGLRMLEADSFQQVENQSLFPMVVEEQRELLRDLTERVFRGESGTLEFQIVGLKGGRRWLETHATPLRDEHGRVTALLGITRDVTERKQAETILVCQTQVLEKIATGAPLAESLAAMLRHIEGFSPAMLCSVLLLDADGQRLRHEAAPSLPDGFNRAVDGVFVGPRACSCGTAAFRREPVIVEDIATDPLWADYRELALAHGLRACWSTPIFDKQQQVLGTFAIYYRNPGRPAAMDRRCIDLATDLAAIAISRERAEAALRESEAKFRAICETSPAGIFLISRDGRVTYGNPAELRLTGLSREDTVGLSWIKAIHPDDREQVIADWQACTAAGRPYAGTGRYLHPDGTVVWWDVVTAPVHDGDTLLGYVGLVINITERKQADEALRQANDRLQVLSRRLLEIQEADRRQLARELHDEIGQALTAVKINLQSLQRFPDPAAATPLVGESVALVDRALQQVRSLSLELRPALLDDLGLLVALRWLADQHVNRAGPLVRFDGSPADARFDTAVETACFRVAQEAFNNIVKHAGARNVSVGLRRRGEELHLLVHDDGTGFDVAAARNRALRGASLGLLGMEERARLAGGGIEWRSTPGQGTEVHAWFALHRPAGTSGTRSATP